MKQIFPGDLLVVTDPCYCFVTKDNKAIVCQGTLDTDQVVIAISRMYDDVEFPKYARFADLPKEDWIMVLSNLGIVTISDTIIKLL